MAFRLPLKALIAAGCVAVAAPVAAEIDSGAYLAARSAAAENDFIAAARYFTQAIREDSTNPILLENAVASHMALGNFDAAASVARQMQGLEIERQVPNLVLLSTNTKSGEWGAIFEALEAGHTVSPLMDGLSQAWAFVGQGNMSEAISTFEDVGEADGMMGFAAYHQALALAIVGDFEGADALLATPGQQYTGRSAMAHAQVLSQLDRNDDAIALLEAVFGETTDPTVQSLLADLGAGGTVPFTIIRSASDGMAEVAYLVAQITGDEVPDSYRLLYTRMAEYLNPNHTPAILLSGGFLEQMEQYDLASETYARISSDDPAFSAAELGRIDVLREAGKLDAAIEAARNLTRSHPDLAATHDKLGDVLRNDENYVDSVPAYSAALDLLSADHPNRWLILYKRAISHHMSDDWPPAEADFRAALELNPRQPQVLNYLGYSLVERNEKLDEALEMIETAVLGAPKSGAIIDSLGWVLFQLGRYDESVGYMETAASLEAVDPIVNDHLGDVYWAVGRKIEANFQWHRALSFDPEPELADRIRRKLEVGLDVVLEEEGADPIQVADDND